MNDKVKGAVKEAIKEMFLNQEIEIHVDKYDKYESRYFVVEVFIDKDRVYRHEEYVGDSGWRDH